MTQRQGAEWTPQLGGQERSRKAAAASSEQSGTAPEADGSEPSGPASLACRQTALS